MESGLKYVISKEGLVKLLVIVFGCITFALITDTKAYKGTTRMEWVFAAFIISCAVSLLFYILRVTGVSKKMGTCGPCTFDGFDFFWAWFCTIWCLAAAVAFATVFPSQSGFAGHAIPKQVVRYHYSAWAWFCTIWCLAAAVAFATVFPSQRGFTTWYNKMITAIVFAFATGVAYAVEAYILRDKAPANLGYISTRNGWLKTIIVALGAATFGLLVDSGYSWCGRGSSCHIAITYALAAFVVGWGITVIIWIIHISGLLAADRRNGLQKFEFIWSVICVLLFFSAAACFAAYMQCNGKNSFRNRSVCQRRLAGVIIGFVTGILYIVDAILNKS